MKRRILAFTLVLAMVICAFAGCSKAPAETKEETAVTPEVTQKPAETEPAKEEPKEPPTKITIGSNAQWQEGWENSEVYEKIWEMANVEVEFIQMDDEQFKLMLASGDFPDIVIGHGTSAAGQVTTIIESKMALDLNPLMEEYAPNMLQDAFTARNQIVSEFRGGEEKALYFLAPKIGVETARGGVETGRGYMVRWDWYKEIGAPAINSDEDYIAAIEQMVANHPTTESGAPVYGIGLYDKFNQWYNRGTFVEPAMTNPWTSSHLYMQKFDGSELINGYTNTEEGAYWVDMRFYNALYNKGLLDPDSFTQTSDARSTKVKAGQYAACASSEPGLYNAMVESDPDTLAGFIRVPSANALVFADKKAVSGNFPQQYVFVSAKSENWEAALRVLNVFHDYDVIRMLWSGIEGKDWNYVDGVPTLTAEYLETKANNAAALLERGIGVGTYLTMTFDSFLHPDGYPMALTDTDEMRAATLNPLYKDFSDYYGVSYPSQASTKLVDEGKTIDMRKDNAQLILTTLPTTPSDVTRIWEKCDDIMYRAIPKLVTAATEAEFLAVQDQVQKDLAEAGEAQAWEWFSTQFQASKDIITPVFESINW